MTTHENNLHKEINAINSLFPLVKRFTNDFKVSFPIIQAPMAGVDNNHLAITVSESGAIGSRGMGYIPIAIESTGNFF